MITEVRLREILDTRFGGVLFSGKHAGIKPQVCALELLSVAMDVAWSDDPTSLRSWDHRQLNDISVPPAIRSECMLPVIAAYAGSRDWPQERQQEVATRLVIGTVNRIIADTHGITPETADQCRAATTLEEAHTAAKAVRSMVLETSWVLTSWNIDAAKWAMRASEPDMTCAVRAEDVACAAHSAANAAYMAFDSCDRIFRTACAVWLDAAKEITHAGRING